MRTRRAMRGQSLAEYAVLFAIVIGAAVAMQQYIGGRLRGAMQVHADAYVKAAQAKGPFDDPNRTVTSDSTSKLTMTSSKAGTVDLSTKSTTTQKKQ